MIVTLFFISTLGGFLAGFLGLGGAVVMIPLMLTVPPLVNVGTLTMKSVAGLSMVQVLFSSMSGIIIHKKNNYVHYQSLLLIGIPMGLFALIGSYFSKYLNNEHMLVLFACVILLAFFLLFFDRNRQELIDVKAIVVNRKLSLGIGAVIGTISGIVGAGGGFILIPLMVKVLKLPLKITIGTSLGIVFIGAIFGSIGKILSFQVEYMFLLPVIIGSLLAARLGARVSKVTPSKTLRSILLVVIALSFLQVMVKII